MPTATTPASNGAAPVPRAAALLLPHGPQFAPRPGCGHSQITQRQECDPHCQEQHEQHIDCPHPRHLPFADHASSIQNRQYRVSQAEQGTFQCDHHCHLNSAATLRPAFRSVGAGIGGIAFPRLPVPDDQHAPHRDQGCGRQKAGDLRSREHEPLRALLVAALLADRSQNVGCGLGATGCRWSRCGGNRGSRLWSRCRGRWRSNGCGWGRSCGGRSWGSAGLGSHLLADCIQGRNFGCRSRGGRCRFRWSCRRSRSTRDLLANHVER